MRVGFVNNLMRIIHTYPFPAPIDDNVPELPLGLVTGGGETYPYRLSLMQAKNGHDVRFLTCKFDGIAADPITRGSWSISYLSAIKRNSVQYALMIPLFFKLLFTPADVYVCHQLPTVTTLITTLVARIKRKPSIVQYLGFRPEINRDARILSRINSLLMTRMIFPNQYAADFFKDYVVESKSVILPYGVDIDYYSQLEHSSRPESMHDENLKYVLYVGRLLSSKGIDVLIHSFDKVYRKDSSVRLVLVGKGPFREYLENLIQTLGLSDVVYLVGFVPDEQLGSYYYYADVFVLPSVYTDCFGNYHPEPEAFGLVLAEAMCNNTAVIASNVGGVPSWIVDQQNGLLFESGDVDGLTEKLLRLLTEEDLASNLKVRAIEMLEENHSLQKVANSFLSLKS